MTTYYKLGDALKANKVVVLAERIEIEPKRMRLTHEHTGQRARARGEPYAYIDIPLQSVPGRLK